MIRGAIKEAKKAKKPNIINKLSDWVKIKYPDVSIIDHPGYSLFQSKDKPNGSTGIHFKNGKSAKEFIDSLKKTIYKDLQVNWAASDAEVIWPQNY